MTPEELKKRVLKYLNKNGDTFGSITFQLLNSGIEQHNIQYLLNELERDQLIILGRANDRLNTNQHVLSATSRIEARITPQGRTYVKEHLASSWLGNLEKNPIVRILLILSALAGLIALLL